MNTATKVMVLVLAVIGGIALISILGMWFMHASMMDGSMGGEMNPAAWFVGLLALGLLIAVVALLARSGKG